MRKFADHMMIIRYQFAQLRQSASNDIKYTVVTVHANFLRQTGNAHTRAHP